MSRPCPVGKNLSWGRGVGCSAESRPFQALPLPHGHNSLLFSHLATSYSCHVHATSSRKASPLLPAKPLLVIWLGSLSGMSCKLQRTGPCPSCPPDSLGPTQSPAHGTCTCVFSDCPQGVMSGDWPPRAGNGAGATLLFILFPGLSRTLPRRELVLRKSVHLPSANP